MAETLSDPNKMIITDFIQILKNNGYSKQSSTSNDPSRDLSTESWSTAIQPNPIFQFYQHPTKKTLVIEMLGNLYSFMTEICLRYFKQLGLQPKIIQVYSTTKNEKLFEIESIHNPLFIIQQHFENEMIIDVKLVIQMGAIKTQSSIKPRRKALPLGRITGGMRIKGSFAPSQVMFKRRKLSQLARRDLPEPETPYIPPIKPKEVDPIVTYHLPILDELNESQQIILKEILRRPKKKVQSNHIAKKTNLEQDLIRQVLRELVEKNVLRVAAGWDTLRKPADTKTEIEPPKLKTKKPRGKRRKRSG